MGVDVWRFNHVDRDLLTRLPASAADGNGFAGDIIIAVRLYRGKAKQLCCSGSLAGSGQEQPLNCQRSSEAAAVRYTGSRHGKKCPLTAVGPGDQKLSGVTARPTGHQNGVVVGQRNGKVMAAGCNSLN